MGERLFTAHVKLQLTVCMMPCDWVISTSVTNNHKMELVACIRCLLQRFFFWCFICVPDRFKIDYCGTYVSVGVRLVSGETLLQAKNSTGHSWDSNPNIFVTSAVRSCIMTAS